MYNFEEPNEVRWVPGRTGLGEEPERPSATTVGHWILCDEEWLSG